MNEHTKSALQQGIGFWGIGFWLFLLVLVLGLYSAVNFLMHKDAPATLNPVQFLDGELYIQQGETKKDICVWMWDATDNDWIAIGGPLCPPEKEAEK